MGGGRPPADAPYLRPTSFLHSFAGWMTSVRLATLDGSAGKWSGRAQSLVKPTASSGSVRSATGGTGGTGRNCVGVCRLLVATSLRLSSPRSAPCCISLDNMAPGPSSPRLSGFAFVTKGKEYTALDHPLVQARL